MPGISEANFLNDNIELTSASLISSDGSHVDIRYQVADLSIKENLQEFYNSGFKIINPQD